ncbi:hypothetical protein [Nostoc sp.]|uniref:hypothetical protein n=1 Tax=Nostoc sp. TaxID=1180 RepID=UPI002FF6E772
MILETAAIAIGTIIATKALEKTTEKVTEVLLDKTGQFLVILKKHSPDTVAANGTAMPNLCTLKPWQCANGC